MYDLIEATWFRDVSTRSIQAYCDFTYLPARAAVISPETGARNQVVFRRGWTDDRRAGIQTQLGPRKQVSGPGRVLISLRLDPRSDDQRAQWRACSRAQRRADERARHSRAGDWCNAQPFRSVIFADELCVQPGFAPGNINWNEIHEYGRPIAEVLRESSPWEPPPMMKARN